MRMFFQAITICVLVVTIFQPASATPNSKHTLMGFLATAESDYHLKNHSELVKYLKKAQTSTPYLDKVEFRTKTEEFDKTKQKYSLRFYPKGWGETQYSRLLSETIRKGGSLEHEALFNAALRDRYKLILSYFEIASLIRLKTELLVVFNDRISVLKKLSVSDVSFDMNTLITAEDLYVDLQLDLVKLENQLTGVIHNINQAAGYEAEISFDESRIISIEKIEAVINNLDTDPDDDNIYLKDRTYKIEIAKTKFNLEKAKNRDYLSFFQVSYDSDDYDDSEKAYSVELGFKFPFINPDREELNRRKINYLKAKLNYEEEKRATSEKVVSLFRAMQKLIAQYHILANRKSNSNAQASFKTYMEMDGIDPLTLLKLKESILNNDMQLTQFNYLIRSRFIQLMNVLGKLSERPCINYLSINMETIQ